MAKSSGLSNAPGTTGKPSGGGRGNNPAKTAVKTASDSSPKTAPKKE